MIHDYKRYKGAQIGIYNPSGGKVGKVVKPETVHCALCGMHSTTVKLRGTMPKDWYGHWDGSIMHRVCSHACLITMARRDAEGAK